MAPRKRSAPRRNWPDYLYERDGYYSWRNPITRTEYGLGRDRADAFRQAREANAHIFAARDRPSIVDRMAGVEQHTVGGWLGRYQGILDSRQLADNTRRTYKSLSKRARAMLGDEKPLRSITALHVAEAIGAIEADDKARLAQAFRSFLKDAFREAVVQGWIDESPVRATRSGPVKVKRSRLTLDVFREVYDSCRAPWLRNAMALAIVSAQRREDIAEALFADFRDGGWWLSQRKTGNRLVLPLDLRLDAVDLCLGDVLKACRSTGVLSRHLIHQTGRRGNSPPGRKIWKDTLSRRFGAAIAALGRDWGGKEPPTFHEIRSLSERLYSLQGNVSTQELLGHKDPRMTAVYHDTRGAEWVRVRAS